MSTDSKRKTLKLFSDARIAFEKEVRTNHPKLAMKMILANQEAGTVSDEGVNIGTAAAEFNIVMDGNYNRQQIEDLYEHLFHRLRQQGKTIIHTTSKVPLPPSGNWIH